MFGITFSTIASGNSMMRQASTFCKRFRRKLFGAEVQAASSDVGINRIFFVFIVNASVRSSLTRRGTKSQLFLFALTEFDSCFFFHTDSRRSEQGPDKEVSVVSRDGGSTKIVCYTLFILLCQQFLVRPLKKMARAILRGWSSFHCHKVKLLLSRFFSIQLKRPRGMAV